MGQGVATYKEEGFINQNDLYFEKEERKKVLCLQLPIGAIFRMYYTAYYIWVFLITSRALFWKDLFEMLQIFETFMAKSFPQPRSHKDECPNEQ